MKHVCPYYLVCTCSNLSSNPLLDHHGFDLLFFNLDPGLDLVYGLDLRFVNMDDIFLRKA